MGFSFSSKKQKKLLKIYLRKDTKRSEANKCPSPPLVFLKNFLNLRLRKILNAFCFKRTYEFYRLSLWNKKRFVQIIGGGVLFLKEIFTNIATELFLHFREIPCNFICKNNQQEYIFNPLPKLKLHYIQVKKAIPNFRKLYSMQFFLICKSRN